MTPPPLRGRQLPRPAKAPAVAPPPPLLRDPWALAAGLAILPLLASCWGAPLGEPVAEDFDFLHRVLFHGMGTLLDGGGSGAFWRPLAHQVYYAALGHLSLTHPLVLALVHAGFLAAGALLLYRAFRPSLPGAAAAAAASFPLLAESTRTLVGWPTQFVDAGLFFFSALAVHEASRRRLPGALLALLAALLCKEVGVVTAVMLPLLPGPALRGRRGRWAIGCGALLLAWAGAYLAVRHAAHLVLPHGLERDPQLAAVGGPARFAWALGGSLKSLASLPIAADAHDLAALGLALGLLVIGLLTVAASARARRAWAARRGWIGWGAAWFALATSALSTIYPLWQPNRAQVGSVGAGVALAALAEGAQPALLGALVAGRLVLLALAPHAARTTSRAPAENGAFMDFERLTRLQRFMRETRLALRSAPKPPRASYIVQIAAPRALLYAYGGDKAVQVWFRDSTLRMIPYSVFRKQPGLPAAAILLFQPGLQPEIYLLPVAAARAQEDAFHDYKASRWPAVLAGLARADSLCADPRAAVFHANNAGFRALTLYDLGQRDAARAEARRGVLLDPSEPNSRLVLGGWEYEHDHLDLADLEVDSLQHWDPSNAGALDLRQQIARARAGAPQHH